MKKISLKNVRVHNLKGVSLELNPHALIVFTGVSGSGKSSLAFDTIYNEGQRRYVESLSTYARRFLEEMPKPEADLIEGLSPTISIEQKSIGSNPRSTVGTITEIYDYLRVLFAKISLPHCPISKEPVAPQSQEKILARILSLPKNSKLAFLAPLYRNKKGTFKDEIALLLKQGFTRARIDGKWLDLTEEIDLIENTPHDFDVITDRFVLREEDKSRLTEALRTALEIGKGQVIVHDFESKEDTLFSEHAFAQKSGLSYPPLDPLDFSFNNIKGMCPTCKGLGELQQFDLDLIIDENLSISEDCCSVASSYSTVRYGNIYDNLAKLYDFDIDTPWKKLPAKAKDAFLYGIDKKWVKMEFVHPEKKSRWVDYIHWSGVLNEAMERYNQATSKLYREKHEVLMKKGPCPTCRGSRLKPYPSHAQLGGKTIQEITHLSLKDVFAFFSDLHLTFEEKQIASELIKEIQERLSFLLSVGLSYLSLERTSPTLSGGEAQRVRLAAQLGCGLVGVTYILDEPSIGLHARDNEKLIQTLEALRDKGNSVIVVEHDEETMRRADTLVDFGPGAGTFGGEIVYQGSFGGLLKEKRSLTGQYLAGKKEVFQKETVRKKNSEKMLVLHGAKHNNLKNITASFPLGLFISVTGVSGSGKSSLVLDLLHPMLRSAIEDEKPIKNLTGHEHVKKVIAIDQSPIGRTPRSNPATYTKLFDDIRNLFAELPQSKAKGFKSGRFSFNVKEGSCTTCHGMGMIKLEMDFLSEQWIECPVCHSQRFDEETLSILYKGKNIHQVLQMSIEEAKPFFENIPSIRKKLELLEKVGLGYLKLGQPSTTLSGGEAQRIKLAKELVRPSSEHTVYILDEPTTGLHFHDIHHLLKILHELVDQGHTVLTIEHNLDVIASSDWIIDLGPEAGMYGGEVIAEGIPPKIAKQESPTGLSLKAYFDSKNQNAKIQPPEKKHFAHSDYIEIENASEHNLKNVSMNIQRGSISIFTGPSGSGKSSLAFDTLYAEGQRRYTESLSPYARQFVKQMPKPKVGRIEGLSPAIAIEQKTHAGNPRSTVGTMTEVYDYLRLLYAHKGIAHCPETGEVIKSISKEHVVDEVLTYPEGEKIAILAPLQLKKNTPFETLLQELRQKGFIRLRLNGKIYDLDEEIPFDKKQKNTLELVIDRLKCSPAIRERLFDAVTIAAQVGKDQLIIQREHSERFFNLSFSVPSTGKSYPPITPKTFAFNTSEGMCPECLGIGSQYGMNLLLDEKLRTLSCMKLIRQLWKEEASHEGMQWFTLFCKQEGIDYDVPLEKLPLDKALIFLNGSQKPITLGKGLSFYFRGIQPTLSKLAKAASSPLRDDLIPLVTEMPCSSCQGARLNPLARHVALEGITLPELCNQPVEEAAHFLLQLKLNTQEKKVLQEVLTSATQRLSLLVEIGLGYLSLNRKSGSLSSGESQRIRLARQLGSQLTGVLYILDEPTVGLHPQDTHLLNKALKKLQKLGNTLVLVEHDLDTIEEADHLFDFGPQAGEKGGYLLAQGTLQEVQKNKESVTAPFLKANRKRTLSQGKRPLAKPITILNATLNNLKNIRVEFFAGAFNCLTGVSGSGKSTLLYDLFAPLAKEGLLQRQNIATKEQGSLSGIKEFHKLIAIDQNPIGTTNRADVATYSDLLTPLRAFFAKLPHAMAHGLMPKHFSPNHPKGMCSTCKGLGYKKISLHFLPDVAIPCDACHGFRLNPLSLSVKYKDKHLGDYLKMSLSELETYFSEHPKICRILSVLKELGLSYLKLGQEMQTLSGGEAQRLKLARELSKPHASKTLFLLDEPTTGLHFKDTELLLKALEKLVSLGHTVIAIEHNLDLISQADWVVELGPQAGTKGGHLIAQGTPLSLSQDSKSITGKYLK